MEQRCVRSRRRHARSVLRAREPDGGCLDAILLSPHRRAALEEFTGTLYAGPTSPNVQCMASVQPFCPRFIDDALEAAAGPEQPPRLPLTLQSFCRRIDDGALEATAVDVGPTATVTANHPFTYCPRINGALEAVAGPEQPPRLPLTLQSFCKRIDDGELETAAAMIAAPSFDTVCASTIGRRCLRIDESAH